MSVARVSHLRLAGLLTCCAPLLACASQIDETAPSFATLQILRNQNVPPMARGAFTARSPAMQRAG